MKERDLHLLGIRPQIPSENPGQMQPDESFQTQTLRPIIELQNDLLIEAFRNYIHKHKNVFYDLAIDQRLRYIDNAIQKDMKFRNSLKGMVIGQFTLEEYRLYIANSSALNKRMMSLVSQQLKQNIQLFDPLYIT